MDLIKKNGVENDIFISTNEALDWMRYTYTVPTLVRVGLGGFQKTMV